MATTLRHLTASDIDAVLRLQDACYEPPLREQASAFLSKLTLSPTTCYGIELESTGLVAYGFSFPCDEAQLPELNTITPQHGTMDTLYIHDIAVEPSMRRCGLATQILEHMVRDAVRLGLPTLTLTAVDGAIGYWMRQGFQQFDGTAPGYGKGASRMRLSTHPGAPIAS